MSEVEAAAAHALIQLSSTITEESTADASVELSDNVLKERAAEALIELSRTELRTPAKPTTPANFLETGTESLCVSADEANLFQLLLAATAVQATSSPEPSDSKPSRAKVTAKLHDVVLGHTHIASTASFDTFKLLLSTSSGVAEEEFKYYMCSFTANTDVTSTDDRFLISRTGYRFKKFIAAVTEHLKGRNHELQIEVDIKLESEDQAEQKRTKAEKAKEKKEKAKAKLKGGERKHDTAEGHGKVEASGKESGEQPANRVAIEEQLEGSETDTDSEFGCS